MNSKEIEILLEKFYEGNTTPIEERQLRDFFTKEEVPPELRVHTNLFQYYKDAEKESLSDPKFENRFLSAIEETPIISIGSGRKSFFYLTGIAAGLLLLVGLVFTFRNDGLLHSTKKQVSTEIAYQQTKDALAMVSANLNAGLDQAKKLGKFQKGLNELQKLKDFQKGIDQMNKLSKFYQYQQLIINPDEQNRP